MLLRNTHICMPPFGALVPVWGIYSNMPVIFAVMATHNVKQKSSCLIMVAFLIIWGLFFFFSLTALQRSICYRWNAWCTCLSFARICHLHIHTFNSTYSYTQVAVCLFFPVCKFCLTEIRENDYKSPCSIGRVLGLSYLCIFRDVWAQSLLSHSHTATWNPNLFSLPPAAFLL